MLCPGDVIGIQQKLWTIIKKQGLNTAMGIEKVFLIDLFLSQAPFNFANRYSCFRNFQMPHMSLKTFEGVPTLFRLVSCLCFLYFQTKCSKNSKNHLDKSLKSLKIFKILMCPTNQMICGPQTFFDQVILLRTADKRTSRSPRRRGPPQMQITPPTHDRCTLR